MPVPTLVGQAVMQAVHLPQWSFCFASGGSGRVVSSSARKNHVPIRVWICTVDLPFQPRPDSVAKSR